MSNRYAATDRAHGVMFHHFHGGPYEPSQGSISADDLRQILDYVGVDRILTPKDWAQRANEGRLEPRDLCLTFDDCLRCQFDIALPVLDELGLKAFWFLHTAVYEGAIEKTEVYREFRHRYFPSIEEFYLRFEDAIAASAYANEVDDRLNGFDPSEYVKEFTFYSDADRRFKFIRDQILGRARFTETMDRMIAESPMDLQACLTELWMRPGEISKLSRGGHEIGLHSHTHPTRMAHLSAAEQAREYDQNLAWVQKLSDKSPCSMSHPCNSYTPDTLHILKRKGMRVGFRSNMAHVSEPSSLELPREDHTILMRQIIAN